MSSYKQSPSNFLSCCSCNILPYYQDDQISPRNVKKRQFSKKSLKTKQLISQKRFLSQANLTSSKNRSIYITKSFNGSNNTVIILQDVINEQQQSLVSSKQKISQKQQSKSIGQIQSNKDMSDNIYSQKNSHQISRVKIDLQNLSEIFDTKEQVYTTAIEKSGQNSEKSLYKVFCEKGMKQMLNSKESIDQDCIILKKKSNPKNDLEICKNVEIIICNYNYQLKQTNKIQEHLKSLDEQNINTLKKLNQEFIQTRKQFKSKKKSQAHLHAQDIVIRNKQNQKQRALFLGELKILKSQFQSNKDMLSQLSSKKTPKIIKTALEDVLSLKINQSKRINNKASLKEKKSMRLIKQQSYNHPIRKSHSNLLFQIPTQIRTQEQSNIQVIKIDNKKIPNKKIEEMMTADEVLKNCMFKKHLPPLSSRVKTLTSVSFRSKNEDFSDISPQSTKRSINDKQQQVKKQQSK